MPPRHPISRTSSLSILPTTLRQFPLCTVALFIAALPAAAHADTTAFFPFSQTISNSNAPANYYATNNTNIIGYTAADPATGFLHRPHQPHHHRRR